MNQTGENPTEERSGASEATTLTPQTGLRRGPAKIVCRIAVVVALAVLGGLAAASPASAATVPYAAAGNISCVNGVSISSGQVAGTTPNYFYPARPTTWPGELDYYRMELQLWTNSGWSTVGSSRWIPIYGQYGHQWVQGSFSWDIWTSGYYRVVYTMYWTPTGQYSQRLPTGYCYVDKPTASGMWTMN